MEEMVKRFGKPSGMEEFCNKMQLMNAIGYQGIFEAAGHKLNDIGGVMLWKLNAAFPSVVWQVYDWFLQTNAGYYFMQNAIEPVHIQLNLNSLDVLVINRTYKAVPDLVATVDIYSLDSKSLFHTEKNLSLVATDVKQAVSLSKAFKGVKGANFVVLNLKNSSGNIVSHNVYWLSKDEDFTAFNSMIKTTLKVELLKGAKSQAERSWTVRIINGSDRIAFFIRPQVLSDGEEVLPSFWSGSYFTLAPGESTILNVSCPLARIQSAAPVLKVSGWNVPAQLLNLPE
jgi:hypothetical protein